MKKKFEVFAVIIALFLLAMSWNAQLLANSLQMKEYKLNQEIMLQLPLSSAIVHEEQYSGSEIKYSAYFEDEVHSFRGYLQLWQLDHIEKFLESSRLTSVYDYSSYSVDTAEVNHLNGLVNTWTASIGKSYQISAKEYWLKRDTSSEVLRISFLTSNDSFSEQQLKIQDQILDSIKWPKPLSESRI